MIPRVLVSQPEIMSQQRNRLLDSLDEDSRALLAPHLIYVNLHAGQCLSSVIPGSPIACFPLTLVASMVQMMADGRRFEVGLVGSEGMIGWEAVLGDAAAPQAGFAQLGGGSALAVPAPVLAKFCRERLGLHTAILSFVRSFVVQMSHTIVANLRDGIDRRLARWLLMLHDRVEGDVLPVTHSELAATLHVRRASITDTLHILEGDHVMRCTRGHVMIRDRAALEAIAGDSYGPAEASYRALIGDFGKN